MKITKNLKDSQGVLLLELALVLPLLMLILFVGILELGRLLSQVSWLANVSYVSVLAGGEMSPGPQGRDTMNSKFDQLLNLQSASISSFSRVPQYDSPLVDQVEMNVTAQVRTLTRVVTLPISMKLVGPMLMLDPTLVGSLNDFDNPSCLYDCAGVRTHCCSPYVGCGAAACGFAVSPPTIPGKVLAETTEYGLEGLEQSLGGIIMRLP